MMKFLSLFLLCLSLQAEHLSSLYSTLDPNSVAQHFAFYELYPTTKEGRNSLRHAWELLKGTGDPEMILPAIDLQPMITLVNRTSEEQTPLLSDEQLAVIERLSQNLGNRNLRGFNLWNQEEILALQPNEMDIARGLLVAEIGSQEKSKIRSYEATLDLMALQILARLTPDATPLQKVRAINDYIFSEMRFRFPPHSLHAKDIDLYTFLPSVLDSRKGVCLGVSILYLCLAQRLDLQLESVTPPGHIYVRHVSADGEITNIETTARGIDLPSEVFLGVETKSLQTRNPKEVIGLAFMNQAAVSWHREDPFRAIELYQKAMPFLPNDYLLNMFLGFNYLFVGKEAEGKALLEKVKGVIPEHAVSTDTVSEDYLAGLADAESIRTVFSEVNETRTSILNKRKKIEAVVQKYPKFRQGLLALAITYLQLGREKEALPILERYHAIHPQDPTVNYYLSAIHLQRRNYPKSWKYLNIAEKLVKEKNHEPKALQEIRKKLQKVCPQSED
ncbi:MAG TPA: transglutaminase family protein [Chlamydiales bacterium]|nr:transglutaminase family protein [Chlamydiales bacterium]